LLSGDHARIARCAGGSARPHARAQAHLFPRLSTYRKEDEKLLAEDDGKA